MTMLTNRNESARIVAAAGFMLKHENMNATDTITLAFTARNRWQKTNRTPPSWAAPPRGVERHEEHDLRDQHHDRHRQHRNEFCSEIAVAVQQPLEIALPARV